MTKLIAITGGIGAGKSTFSKEVLKRNLSLLDSDEQVAKIYKKPSKDFLKVLKETKLISSRNQKKINKKHIANTVFSNNKTKKKLEKYIFKILRLQRKDFIRKQKKLKKKIIFFDIPLLFENKLNNEFDFIISIVSLKKQRYSRVKKNKKMSKSLFNKIIKSQTTDKERKKKSDVVLKNNGKIDDYKKNINRLLDKIIL